MTASPRTFRRIVWLWPTLIAEAARIYAKIGRVRSRPFAVPDRPMPEEAEAVFPQGKNLNLKGRWFKAKGAR